MRNLLVLSLMQFQFSAALSRLGLPGLLLEFIWWDRVIILFCTYEKKSVTFYLACPKFADRSSLSVLPNRNFLQDGIVLHGLICYY